MFSRAALVWFAIMIGAILNGAFRDIMLVPRLGDPVARAISCFTLAGIIALVTWTCLQWIQPASVRDAWAVGEVWLVMTLAFEFGAGHYLFGTPWAVLLAEYNVFAGRLWVLVLAATLTAPPLVYGLAGNSPRESEISSDPSDDKAQP